MLHGRTAEQAVLDGLVADAAESNSRVLVLRGEPGVGKTALLNELAARRGPLRLMRCTAIESEVELPYAALHQLAYPLVDRFDQLPPPQAQALRAAFGLESGHGENHFTVAVAVLTLLADVAAETGLLCLVDDTQWLDQASAKALGFAARRLHGEGVALVFAVRSGNDGWFDPTGLPTLTLAGLDQDDAAALLAAQSPGLPAGVARSLVTGTGGNPLALVELPSALRSDQLSGEAPLPDPLPVGRTVEQIFAAAARRQPEPTQRLMLLAAADNSGDVGVLLRAADALDIDSAALGPAEQSGLVQVRDGRVEFKHPLVRSAIYQGASFTARASAHRALAEAFDDPQDADRRFAHRAAAAIGPDPQLARELAEEARRIGDRYGAAAAAATWERSAGLTPQGRERDLRLHAAAEAAWLAGFPQRALALLDRLDPRSSGTALALRLRGLIELRCGEPDGAYQLLVDSAVQAAVDEPHLALEALVMAGEAASFSGDAVRTIEVGRMAGTIRADTHPDDAMTVLMLTGVSAGMSADWETAASALRRVVDAAAASTNPVALVRAGRAAFYIGDDEVARSLHGRAVIMARRMGAVGALPLLLDRLAFSHLLAGRLSDAAIAADEGIQLSAQTGQLETRAHQLVTVTLVESWRGDEEACRAHAAEAAALAQERGILLVSSAIEWALGLLDLGSGRIPQALDRLAELVEGASHPAVRIWATPDMVEAAVRARRPDVAWEALQRYERWAERNHATWARAATLRGRAQLDGGRDAVDVLRTALDVHPPNSRPLERARTRLAYGEALRRARRPNAARSHLRAALEEFDRAGARPWAARAATELRATGETIRARAATSMELLTPQELQIARLAADGTSNPTIAEQLFLSRRTVEYHLRKVFIKLGVASRGELARVDLG